MIEGDIEDIELLLGTLDAIELINEGPMALSEDQAADLGDIRVFLENAEENAGDQGRLEIKRDEDRAKDLVNAYIVEKSGGSIPTDLADPAVIALQQRMRDEEIHPTSILNVMANDFGKMVNAHISGGARPDMKTLDQVTEDLWDIPTHQGRVAFIRAADLPTQTKDALMDTSASRDSRDRRIAALTMKEPDGTERVALALAENNTQLLMNNIANIKGLDRTAIELKSNIDAWVYNAGKAVSTQAFESDHERSEAINKALKDADSKIEQVTIDGGADFDIELARKLQLPGNIIRGMEEVSRAEAEAQLMADRRTLDTAGLEDAGDVALFGGWAWHRAVFDYAGEIHESYENVLNKPGASPQSRSKAKAENDKLVAEMQTDAAKFITEFQQRAGDSQRIGGRTSFYQITPEGVIGRGYTDLGIGEMKAETTEFLQAIRILGLTPDQMKSGDASGIGVENFDILKDPMRTGMIPVDSFESDLSQLANTNTPSMSQEELLGKLEGNGIAEGYNAYVEMVGVNDAIGFEDFLNLQINGIGRFRLPVPDTDVLKRLERAIDLETTQ